MLRKFKRDKRGVLYVYGVLIMALAASLFFGFLLMNVVEKIQDAVNPLLDSEEWASDTHYDMFYYASLFVTNIWTYIMAFIVLIIAYWGYTYSQRKAAGYA